MTDTIAYGRVENIKAFPSTGLTRIEITIPVEAYPQAVALLFGKDVLVSIPSPGIKAALGRYGVHTADEPPAQEEAPKLPTTECGPLCKWAGMVCKEPTFWEYLGVEREDAAVSLFRHECGVGSRRELDDNPVANRLAHKIRHEYMAWKSSNANITGAEGVRVEGTVSSQAEG